MRIIDAHLAQHIANKELSKDEAGIVYWVLSHTPTIDPEELRQKGEWIGEADGYADGELVYDVWNCSECNYCIDDGTDAPELLPNYCPNCGAKMRDLEFLTQPPKEEMKESREEVTKR